MRRLAFAFLLFASTASAADSSLFKQANEDYQKGNFKAAAETYQKMIPTGDGTAAVFYNLGNAALKSGEKGQALVYYERARRVSPRDKDLLWNIRILKSALVDKIEDRSYFAVALFRAFLDKWTVDELAIAWTSFLAFAAFFGALCYFSTSFRLRAGALRVLAWTGVAAFGVLFALKIWDVKAPHAVVLDKETTAYFGPSDRETKAFVLHEGAEGRVIDESGEWIYVQLENGNTGWVRKNSSETI